MSEESNGRIPGAPDDLPFAEESSSPAQGVGRETSEGSDVADLHDGNTADSAADRQGTSEGSDVADLHDPNNTPPPAREGWVNASGNRRGVTLIDSRVRGRATRAANYAKERVEFLERLKVLIGEVGHLKGSTSLIAKRLRVTRPTVLTACEEIGVNLQELRAAHEAGKEIPVPPSQAEREGLICGWGWSILKLFDTLQPYFDIVESAKSADDAVEQEATKEETRHTWIAWRVFLASAFGLARELVAVDHDDAKPDVNGERPLYPTYPGLTADVPRGAANLPPGAGAGDIYQACTGRTTWPSVQARLVSLIVGRRGGKSYITAIIGIYLACCRTYRLKLGTKGMVMILARDKEQAGVIRGYILAFLKAIEPLAAMLADTPNQKLIELKNGLTIEVRAVSEGGTRGYTVVAALMDEVAFWPTDPDSAKQDKKILRALRPAMFGIKNAMIVMLSSPYAQRGVLYENHRAAYGKDDAKGFVWQADTLSMRPEQDDELLDEIRDLYEEDPDSAKAEYGAQFRADLESIFTKTAIEAVAQPGRVEQARSMKHRYRAFVDPSGGSSDSYVLAIAHDEARKVDGELVMFAVLDKVREWVPKFDPEEVSKEVVQICKDFGVRKVIGDAYGGEWPRDPLKKRGIDYELSKMNRSELYLAGVSLVNSRRCEILDVDHHKKLVNQLINLERRTGRTGKDSIDHPPGSHDDVANGVMGVLVTGRGAAGARCTWDDEDDLAQASD